MPDQVILGNGSDEILGLLARTFLSPGDEAVMAEHTFVIYKMEVQAAHGVAVEVPQKNWHHDLPALAAAITDKTRLLFVCNPNNPTGTMATKAEVAALMARVPDHVVVVFDEAYYEYVRHPEFPESLSYVNAGRNVIVLRTFSKIYGLAGLRIGYADNSGIFITIGGAADYRNPTGNVISTVFRQRYAIAPVWHEFTYANVQLNNFKNSVRALPKGIVSGSVSATDIDHIL